MSAPANYMSAPSNSGMTAFVHSLASAASPCESSGEPATAPHRDSDDSTAYEIKAINGLIVSVLDNVDEYRRAIFALEQRLDTLQRGVYNRVQLVEQLQARVRTLGGQPATTRSTLAAALGTLLAVRTPFVKDHEQELMRDIERGEQSIKKQFQACLVNSRLSETARRYLGEAQQRIGSDWTKPAADGWNQTTSAIVTQASLVATPSLQSSMPGS
jgi:uncharacterized protein (TIGR02284 family)